MVRQQQRRATARRLRRGNRPRAHRSREGDGRAPDARPGAGRIGLSAARPTGRVQDPMGGRVTILLSALLCARMVLLLFSATPVNDTDLTWSWYAGIGCVTVAAFIAATHGWSA